MADSNSNAAGPDLADVPPIQTFQFESDAVGAVKKSVNLFRGDVNLPLKLVSLSTDHGANAAVNAIYDGNGCHQANVWNLEAPTGILGLGWSLPIEQIVATRAGAASDELTAYYLRSGGSASQMIPAGTDADGSQLFQLQAYQFWRVRYYEQQQRWEITKEDGTTSVYGGSSAPGTSDGNAVQWGVAWGNWVISTAQTLGQAQIPTAWNLRRVVAPDGSAIAYAYDALTQAVGQGGKSYTKACYLASIASDDGRAIQFVYGDKVFDPGRLCEYQDPHKPVPNDDPDGYQSQYENKFLDSIVVTAADGSRVTSVAFSYDFFNTARPSDPAYPFLAKRTLVAVHLQNAAYDTLPGMRFTYQPANGIAPGRLASVEYPQGATATYSYGALSLPATRQLRVTNPFTASTPGIPRVWHGPDYTVVTWYDAAGGRLQVSAYSWSGTWIDWTPANERAAQLDVASLQVIAAENYFAVFYPDTARNEGVLLLYRRDPTALGTWTETVMVNGMRGGEAPSSFAAGDDFVVVANPLFSNGAFIGAWWNWTTRSWMTPLLPTVPVGANPQIALTGLGNFYVVCSYDGRIGSFQLISLAQNVWQSRSWNNTFTVLQGSGAFPFVWDVQPTYAVATYLSTFGTTTATGEARAFQWDASYNPISPGNPFVQAISTPVVGGKPVIDVLGTRTAGATLANGAALSRYIGTGPNVGWAGHSLEPQPTTSATYGFAYGPDAAVMLKSAGGTSSAIFSAFDPNVPNAAGWSQNVNLGTGSGATVGAGFVTVDDRVYQLGANGRWTQSPTRLFVAAARTIDPASVRNRAPSYIAYQDTAGPGTLTYVALIRNGALQQGVPLAPDPQAVYVPGRAMPGTDLAAPLAFVTYPATARFDAAPFLMLYRVVDEGITGALTDNPVTGLTIANGFDDAVHPPSVQSYTYQTADMTLDTVTGIAQYALASMTTSAAGRIDFYYSNGLSTAAQRFYTAGWVWNYARILNGTLLAAVARDAGGAVVSTDVKYYRVFAAGQSTTFLYGGYARPVRQTSQRDGVSTATQTQYDAQSGLPTIVTSSSYMGSSVPRIYERRTTYAFQVPAYASAMRAAWMLSPVAQVVTSSDGAPVSSTVTTFRDWAAGGSSRWAAQGSYRWKGGGQPSFDFTPAAPNAGWLADRIVLARTRSGRIAERANATGLVTSYQFDVAGRFQIAAFTNASVANGEAAYLGFEPYQPTTGWTIENTTTFTDDAHTGTRSLSIPAGATGLARSFGASADMLLVAWIKTPPGFAQDGGAAEWRIDVSGTATTVPVTDTGGAWRALVQRIAVPAGSTKATVAVRCVNEKTTASFAVDDVRIGPFAGGFAARTFDMPRRLVTARLDGALATRKFLYDGFGSRIAQLGPSDASGAVAALSSDGLSRESTAANVFNPAMPNPKVSITPRTASAYLDLPGGAPLATQYAAQPQAAWRTDGDAVLYAGGGPGTLTFTGTPGAPPCAFHVTVDATSPLASPFSIGFTDAGVTASATFDPATAAYTLVVGSTVVGTESVPMLSLTTDFAAPLDAGQITPAMIAAFGARGWTLSAGASVQVRRAGAVWAIADPVYLPGYYVVASGESLDVSVLAREWQLVAGTSSILLFLDGLPLFGAALGAPLKGAPHVALADPLALRNLIVAADPQTGVTYSDGAARKVQARSVHDAGTIAQQTLYDAAGSTIAQTKAAQLPPGPAPLLAYAPGFVTAFDTATGVMQGAVSDANPNDQGYPYSGTRYERSPLARVVELGHAGKTFAIDLTVPPEDRRTTSYAYGGNSAADGLPPNEYFTRTVTNPQGSTSVAFTDKATRVQVGRRIDAGTASQRTSYTYDAAGNVCAVNMPNYYAPPAGTSPGDWVLSFTYDFQGNVLTQTTPDEGTTEFVFDPGSRLRFKCDAEGAANGYVVYYKYDSLGRPTENGFYATAFDRAALQRFADTQPDWPPAATWQQRNVWDGDGTVPTTIGQLAACRVATAVPGTADVIESFQYDIAGRVIGKSSAVGPRSFRFAYTFDSMGNTTSIAYPDDAGIGEVTYAHDDLGRIVAVGTLDDAAAYAAYGYTPDGSVDTETFQPLSPLPLARAVGHNPPGWISNISATAPGTPVIFNEDVSYTSGGWPGNEGYYDGSIAEVNYAYGSDAGAYAYRLAYDGQGQLVAAKDTVSAQYDVGISTPIAYDPNGNIRQSSVGSDALSYAYGAGDQVQSVASSNRSLARTFTYDLNGNVTSVRGGKSATFTYDRTSGFAASATTQTMALAFSYDGRGRRVAKTWSGGAKTYGYGVNTQPLVEWNGDGSPTAYVYGPAGALAICSGTSRSYVFRDHERSARVLCGTDGSIVASFDYLAFGALSRQSGDVSLTDRRFTGQEYDAELGLYNYRTRFYDADIGRFYAPDDQHQFFSPYLYAANNPISFVDPSGQFGLLAALVEGLIDLAAVAAAGAGEEAATVSTTVAETTVTATEVTGATTETATTGIAATDAVVDVSGLTADTTNSVTTSLHEVSNVATEAVESENATIESLDSSSRTITRYRIIAQRAGYPPDAGGETQATPSPWTRWPLTYLNSRGLTMYDPVDIINNDVPGTPAFFDTQAHEGFHAMVFRYLPFVTWIEEAEILGVNVGAPVLWAEESIAYSVGRIAAGRFAEVPYAAYDAFGSLTEAQETVTLSSFGIGAAFAIGLFLL